MTRLVPFLVLVLGCTGCSLLQNTTNAPTPVAPNVVNYTAVGASDADGVGSSVVCAPFSACPTGMGYVPLLARQFQSAGKTVTLENLGIPGAVLSPEIEAIGNSLGLGIPENFINSEESFVPTDSTLVTIFAGGNDANTIGDAIGAGLGGSNPTGYMQTEIQHFGTAMQSLVTGIQARAPSARIVILNLPNLAALPYSSGDTLAQKQGLEAIAVGFTQQINALASTGAVIVDLMCNANFYNPSSFSSDGFHPNDAGYAYLESVIYPIASTGAGSAPQASCAQMTLY